MDRAVFSKQFAVNFLGFLAGAKGRLWRDELESVLLKITVEGRLEQRTFQDAEGKDRGVVEIIASDVQFLGGAYRRPSYRAVC